MLSIINSRLFVLCGLLLLTGCGRGQAYLLSTQQWRDVSFFVEVRPAPPKPGSNEFLVVATEADGKPAYRYVISIRSNASETWTQTIQDGHSGVFRRAIKLGEPTQEALRVLVLSTDPDAPGQTELQFDLTRATNL